MSEFASLPWEEDDDIKYLNEFGDDSDMYKEMLEDFDVDCVSSR